MSNVISARVSDEVVEIIDRLAASRRRSRGWIVARMLEVSAREQAAFDEVIRQARADIAAGKGVPHAEMMDRLRKRWGLSAAA